VGCGEKFYGLFERLGISQQGGDVTKEDACFGKSGNDLMCFSMDMFSPFSLGLAPTLPFGEERSLMFQVRGERVNVATLMA
jgi:hypothetical protein